MYLVCRRRQYFNSSTLYRVDPTLDGGYLLSCDGSSDLVYGRSTLFFIMLEGEKRITLLGPVKAELVAEPSSHLYRTFIDSRAISDADGTFRVTNGTLTCSEGLHSAQPSPQ